MHNRVSQGTERPMRTLYKLLEILIIIIEIMRISIKIMVYRKKQSIIIIERNSPR